MCIIGGGGKLWPLHSAWNCKLIFHQINSAFAKHYTEAQLSFGLGMGGATAQQTEGQGFQKDDIIGA